MNILINSGKTAPLIGTRKKLIMKLIESNKVVLSGNQMGFENQISELGSRFELIDVQRNGLNPLKDARLIYEYYRLIKKNNIQIVHSYTIKPNIYGSIAARLAKVKYVYPTVNGIGYAFTGVGIKANIVKLFASCLYWIAFKCSTKVFFHNQEDAQLFINKKLIDNEKCVVINGSGIDLDFFSKKNLPERLSFVFISRLLKSKGIMEYLNAAKIVKSIFSHVEFKLVGPLDTNPEGIKIEEIQDYIDEGIVTYYGGQQDVRKFIQESSVFVLPSYREGLSHSILEAMAMGRAIITTDVPGCRETVKNGVNGYVVKPRDANDLADKMIHFINNSSNVVTMGNSSWEIAKEEFDVNKVNDQIISTILDLGV